LEAPPARLHQLDGLRALAVSLVILHHIGAARLAASMREHGHAYMSALIASSTASGVELFFVLSGIVLLRPFLRQRRPLQLGVYVRRRVQRLWPPFLAAWLFAGLVTWLATQFPTPWTRTANLATFGFVSWFAQIGIVYVGNNAFNAAWWSLTVELIFYALVPAVVIVLASWQPTRARLVAAWAVSILIAIAAQAVPSEALPAHAWPIQRFLVHASCFGTGVLIAAHDIPRSWAKPLALIGCAYVIVACAIPELNLHVGWGLIHFALVVTAIDGTSGAARVFSRWPLVWLGERSYSLFLVHMSVFTLVGQVISAFVPSKGAPYYVLTRLVEVPLTLLAAMVIFTIVERRFAHGLVSADAFWPTWRRSEHKDAPSSAVRAPS
jgi:peptidoglycan/LPS O-acetylase OafA/YrhL